MFATSFLFLDCGFIIPQGKAFFCDEVTLIKKSGAQKSTGFLKDESRFPQTMEVAVGVDRFDFIALAESEADLRLLAGMQFLALIALLGLERYPLDVVLRQHGMLHGADLDMDDIVFHRPDGDMLLHGGIGGAGNDLITLGDGWYRSTSGVDGDRDLFGSFGVALNNQFFLPTVNGRMTFSHKLLERLQ